MFEDYNNVWHSKESICSIARIHVCTTTGWRRGISIGQTTVQKKWQRKKLKLCISSCKLHLGFFCRSKWPPFFATDRALWWAFLYCCDQHLVHTQLPRHKMSTGPGWTCVYFLLQLVFNRKRALIWRADILIDIYRAISDKSQLETKKSRFQVNCYLNVCSEPVNKLLITDRSKKLL